MGLRARSHVLQCCSWSQVSILKLFIFNLSLPVDSGLTLKPHEKLHTHTHPIFLPINLQTEINTLSPFPKRFQSYDMIMESHVKQTHEVYVFFALTYLQVNFSLVHHWQRHKYGSRSSCKQVQPCFCIRVHEN